MSPRVFAGWLQLGWTQDPREHWLARDEAGIPCGWYVLGLPSRENPHLAELSLAVHPSLRRTGHGTALVRNAAERAGETGRTMLWAQAREGSPGAAFARAIGARQGMTEVRRVLDLTAVPAARLAGLRRKAESAAAGYSLLSWDGPVPEEHLAAVVAINVAVSADIPREESHEPERFDPERIRQSNSEGTAMGMRSHTVAARSAVTGDLAALSHLMVDPADPGWGLQGLTAVAGPAPRPQARTAGQAGGAGAAGRA